MSQTYGDYQVYALTNGDFTVCRGTWILCRYVKATRRIRAIDTSAPFGWLEEAEHVVVREVERRLKGENQ